MSALTAALAVFDATEAAHFVTPSITEQIVDSPSSSYSVLPSLSTSASASSSDLSLASIDSEQEPTLSLAIAQLSECNTLNLRANEHMAVLLPSRLWKPDALAKRCDNFACSTRFSTLAFRRKHHCRKCGGVFCASCSAHSTALLDTSNLDFLHPPRNVPVSHYDSPESPVTLSRVCNDCYDQVNGTSLSSTETPNTPELIPSRSSTPSSSSASSSSIASTSVLKPNGLRIRSIQGMHRSLPSIITAVDVDDTKSYGELDAYPLKRASALCKVLGGGRWTPAPSCPFVTSPALVSPSSRGSFNQVSTQLHSPLSSSPTSLPYSYAFAPYVEDDESAEYAPYCTLSDVPGTKPRFERDMEREEEAEKKRTANPVVKDGEFQYRFGNFNDGGRRQRDAAQTQSRPERRASTF